MAYEQYEQGLKLIERYGIVTQKQALLLLGCTHKTLEKLVDEKQLHKTKVGKYAYYHYKNKKFTNEQIKKAIMLCETETKRYFDHQGFVAKTDIENTLMQRNVVCRGYDDSYYYYEIHLMNTSTDSRSIEKFLKLVQDIFNFCDSYCMVITVVFPVEDDYQEKRKIYIKALEEDYKINAIKNVHKDNFKVKSTKFDLPQVLAL